ERVSGDSMSEDAVVQLQADRSAESELARPVSVSSDVASLLRLTHQPNASPYLREPRSAQRADARPEQHPIHRRHLRDVYDPRARKPGLASSKPHIPWQIAVTKLRSDRDVHSCRDRGAIEAIVL